MCSGVWGGDISIFPVVVGGVHSAHSTTRPTREFSRSSGGGAGQCGRGGGGEPPGRQSNSSRKLKRHLSITDSIFLIPASTVMLKRHLPITD